MSLNFKKELFCRFISFAWVFLLIIFHISCETVVIITKVETGEATGITESTATLKGNIVEMANETVEQHGFCYAINRNVTIADHAIDLGEVKRIGDFSSEISGLNQNTTYYFKAFAVIGDDAIYGDENQFTTTALSGSSPIAAFTASSTSVYENESISFLDQSSNGPTSWSWTFGDGGTSTSQNPDYSYADSGTYTVSLTVTNEKGSDTETKTDYITVSPAGPAPIADFSASPITIGEGQSVQFADSSTSDPTEWSWSFGDGGTSVDQNPSHTYTNYGNYTVSLTATNSFGDDTRVKTDYITVLEASTVNDYDGNTYNTVRINTQWWMAENLKTTHYPDGSSIPLKESDIDWGSLTAVDDGYCYYNNSVSYGNIYGILYTWEAARYACPSGWHLPSDTEWKQLEMYLGMSPSQADATDYRGTNEGSKMAGRADLWMDGDLENIEVFGSSGLAAIPAGTRGNSGTFYNVEIDTYFWSNTEYNSSEAWCRYLYNTDTKAGRLNVRKYNGFAVRCIKD